MAQAILRVLTIFGTRPEALKLAPVLRELERRGLDSRVCVTAQHREMLDQVLDLFGIRPDWDLDLMRPDQSLFQVTSRSLEALERVLEREQPDIILIQGDTTTAFIAALAGYYLKIKVGHIEAGLRSHDKFAPFPEEINRKVAGVVADLHFAATETAKENLLREGVDPVTIHVTGNPVIDALKMVAKMPYDVNSGPLKGIPWDKRILLVTAHRRENFGKPLENICAALREITERYVEDVQIVYPVHLNPNVQGPVYRLLDAVSNITLLPPLDYLPMVHLMKRCYLVLTDSGGIQEEAPGLGKPVLVLRETTERPEAVDAGTVKIVGTDRADIVALTRKLLDDSTLYGIMARAVNPYGDGCAAEKIVRSLLCRN